MGKPGVSLKPAALVAVAAPWCRSGKPSGQPLGEGWMVG
jgi:hypothetical protein